MCKQNSILKILHVQENLYSCNSMFQFYPVIVTHKYSEVNQGPCSMRDMIPNISCPTVTKNADSIITFL